MFGLEDSVLGRLRSIVSTTRSESEHEPESTRTVTVVCTGHVYDAVGEHRFPYTFEGTTLRELLAALFEEYDVADMLIAETEADATHGGWAPAPEELPGTWKKNPEGEQTRKYARVTVNGRFNEHLDGLDTRLNDGGRVGLIYPFMFCC